MADRPFALDYDGLFRQCADSVYRICLAVLRNHEEAEDAKQEVFRKLLSNPPHRHLDNIRGWLHSAARTTAIDVLRARTARRAVPIDDAPDVSDPVPPPEQIAIDAELVARVKRHLDALTPDQRSVVLLRAEGFTGKEIADALGRSVAWVNTTHKRALEKLRALLADGEPGMEAAV